jgi:uncharacterized protein YicC (UPF0701 family)
MLAATTSMADHTLDSVRLVLALGARNENISHALDEHFQRVIAQTVELLNSNSPLKYRVLPEAISLAVRLTLREELKRLVFDIASSRSFSGETAKQALVELEATFDTPSESTHFSKAVYAAI